MTQALITVNAVAGSNTDLPINTLVQLNNTGNGGETTYAWSILDQPPGTADVLSSSTVLNPTFTPKKEGSYLVQVVVNASLADEQTNRVVCAVRQLKTRLRVPAAGEVAEADASDGWAASANISARLLDTMRADPGLMVAKTNYAGAAVNDVVYFSGLVTLKPTLPDQEIIPLVEKADASPPIPADFATTAMGMVHSTVDGGAFVTGSLVYVRLYGLVTGLLLTPSPAPAIPVYLSTTAGALSTTASGRKLGNIILSGATDSIFFNGLSS